MLCPIVDHLEISLEMKINQDNYSNGKIKILFHFPMIEKENMSLL